MRGLRTCTHRPLRFSNPFPGKPTPLNISGLFLFDPSVQVKLDGMPMRSLLEEQLGSALHKRMHRAMKKGSATPDLVVAMLDAMRDNGNPMMKTLRAVCDGDEAAAAMVDAVGVWETFYSGFTGPPGYRRLYRIAIERASREPTEALRRGDFDAAVNQLKSEPVTRALLWKQAEDALDGATAIQHLQPLQFAGVLEAELSSLAALDVQLQKREGLASSFFSVLVPEEGVTLNPAALFFRWVMRSAGVASMNELVDELERGGCPIHLVSLKNWHRGARLPSVSWLKLIISLKPELACRDNIGTLYWAAKLLMLLGYYGTLVATRSSSAIQQHPEIQEIRTRLRPWPAFPHGYANFESWLRARYQVWLAYHRARIETSPT